MVTIIHYQPAGKNMSPPPLPISVTIIAKNEESRIGNAIRSVSGWTSEVIVVDSGSTDKTCDIARSLGAKVFHNDWQGYGLQKRFAEEKATNDWILNIDADECILDELRAEITQAFAAESSLPDGFFIPIHDRYHITGKISNYVPFCPVRLYRKSKGRYSTSPVHDRVDMAENAKTARLKGRIAHDSLLSFSHRLEKLDSYTAAQVKNLLAKGRKPKFWRIVTEFPVCFFRGYFLRGYWREGLMGYIYATNFAYSRFYRQICLLEAYKRQEHASSQPPEAD